MNDKISVIVPCYNVEEYIDKCIGGLRQQDYENIEIILVDDGATDDTGKKCDEWATRDERIKVIHQENQGVSAARNAGIRAATGKYVAFADPDDMVPSYFISTLYNCITDCGTKMAQGRSKNFFNEADIDSFVSDDVRRVVKGFDMCKSLMYDYHMGWGIMMTKMIDKSLFEGMEFPVGRIHEDDYLIYKLYWNAGEVALTDKIVYHYRSKRKDSITHSKYSIKHLDAISAREERCDFFKSIGEKELYQAAVLSLCYAQIEALNKLKLSDVVDKEKYIKEIRRNLNDNGKIVRSAENISTKKKLSLWMEYYLPVLKRMLKR